MNKRGISGILVTVLLVLLAIGALGIIWVILLSFINSGSESIDLSSNTLKVEVVENSLKYLPGDSLELLVRRDANLGNISGVKVVIDSEGGNSYSVDANVNLDVLESKKIIVPLNGKIDKITKVSVYPLIANGKKLSVGKFSDDEAVGSGFVSSEGLVMYLPFDGDMKDKSGYGNNGSCIGNNCPLTSVGKFGSSYSYDGIDDNVNVGNNVLLNPQDISAFSWVKFDSIDPSSTQNYVLSNSRDCCGSYKGYEIRIISNKLFVRLWNSAADSISGNIDILPNTWYYLGFTYNKTNIILYVNGQIDKSYSSSIGIGSPASYNLAIGGMGMDPVTYNLDGTIDDVRIYNRSLNPQEVYYLYKYGG